MTQNSSDGIRSSLTIDARERTFTTLGSPQHTSARPLVIVFHGSRQTAESHRRFTGDALAPLAARGEAVIAYLDGHRGNWNDARAESRFPARLDGIDDVAFTRAVIERHVATHGIDRSRVIAVGYSNGGQMVMRLLHETPHLIAAGIVIAATMPVPESFLLPTNAPHSVSIPVTLVHGTRDRIVPIDGGTMKRWARIAFRIGGRSLSASATAQYFAARNGAASAPIVDTIPAGPDARGTTVTRTLHEGTAPVILYTVDRGGHTVPGARPAPRVLGRTTGDISVLGLVEDALRTTSRSLS